MIRDIDWHEAKALLDWQVEMGATEAIGEAPVDRYALAARSAAGQAVAPSVRQSAPEPAPRTGGALAGGAAADPVAAAGDAAAAARDLAGLQAAISAFTACDLRRGARSTVFAAGRADAAVMVVGEAPDGDEDRAGRPFVGAAGAMLARMFAAVGLSQDAEVPGRGLYLAAAIPWRPPSRAPSPDEAAMLAPFLRRHVELAGARLVVCMGALPCEILLGSRSIAGFRGRWAEAAGRPALAMHHPLTLMRRPELKRDAWEGLLALRARLREPA